MTLFRWRHNWPDLRNLEREFDQLLGQIRIPLAGIRWERKFPAVNLYETETEYLVVAELPGITPNHLELMVEGGTLTLKGRREVVNEVPEDSYRRRERLFGTWQRSISLPDRVNQEQMSAEFSNGILKIHLPKLPSLQPRQIPVSG